MSFTPKTWKDGRSGGTRQSAAAMIDMETRLSDYTDQEVGALATAVVAQTANYFFGPNDPAPSLPAGTEYRWDETDGAGTLLDIWTGVA